MPFGEPPLLELPTFEEEIRFSTSGEGRAASRLGCLERSTMHVLCLQSEGGGAGDLGRRGRRAHWLGLRLKTLWRGPSIAIRK
jgi:hypothetical protein